MHSYDRLFAMMITSNKHARIHNHANSPSASFFVTSSCSSGFPSSGCSNLTRSGVFGYYHSFLFLKNPPRRNLQRIIRSEILQIVRKRQFILPLTPFPKNSPSPPFPKSPPFHTSNTYMKRPLHSHLDTLRTVYPPPPNTSVGLLNARTKFTHSA